MQKQRSVQVIVVLLDTLHLISVYLDSMYAYNWTRGTEKGNDVTRKWIRSQFYMVLIDQFIYGVKLDYQS